MLRDTSDLEAMPGRDREPSADFLVKVLHALGFASLTVAIIYLIASFMHYFGGMARLGMSLNMFGFAILVFWGHGILRRLDRLIAQGKQRE